MRESGREERVGRARGRGAARAAGDIVRVRLDLPHEAVLDVLRLLGKVLHLNRRASASSTHPRVSKPYSKACRTRAESPRHGPCGALGPGGRRLPLLGAAVVDQRCRWELEAPPRRRRPRLLHAPRRAAPRPGRAGRPNRRLSRHRTGPALDMLRLPRALPARSARRGRRGRRGRRAVPARRAAAPATRSRLRETRPVSTGGRDETCPVSTGGKGGGGGGGERSTCASLASCREEALEMTLSRAGTAGTAGAAGAAPCPPAATAAGTAGGCGAARPSGSA